MSQRAELVLLAQAEDANVAALCRRFLVSRKTAYKWMQRYQAAGPDGLCDRSRRPNRAPGQIAQPMEEAVVGMRRQHPVWGCRKIRRRLQDLGMNNLPAASTVHTVLQRHHLVDPEASNRHRPFQRFERPRPNDLWQMDFKGHFALNNGRRCHPLTVLDDHSRFCLALRACGNEQTDTVREHLLQVFRCYGLPHTILTDNGPPWGDCGQDGCTELEVWFIRLEIAIAHGRPRHPQTQGKDERFHRTLQAELLRGRRFDDLTGAQQRFDPWRDVYNLERPHESLDMAVPAKRYRPSCREYPEKLAPMEYSPGDLVRRVQAKGEISFRGQTFRVGTALRGYPVALRPTDRDGVWEIYFCHQRVARIDLCTTDHEPQPATEKG